MNAKYAGLLSGWVLGLVLSVSAAAAEAAGSSVEAVMLLYLEREAGTDAYPVRMLVTPDYLRIDDNRDAGDFVLFERDSGRVTSVAHDTRTLVRIERFEFDRSASPDYRIDLELAEDAPPIGGHAVSEYRLRAGDTLCADASVVPGLLGDAARALAAYERVLAGRHFQDLDKTPAEFRTPCYLANYVYAGDRMAAAGLPVRMHIRDGRERLLVDYAPRVSVAGELFKIPEGYELLQLP